MSEAMTTLEIPQGTGYSRCRPPDSLQVTVRIGYWPDVQLAGGDGV